MIKIGLLGLGTVGTGVVELLEQNRKLITQRLGEEIEIKRILIRNKDKKRTPLSQGNLTLDFEEILKDQEISIIVELMGAKEPALTYIKKSIAAGKHVVTANKEVIAKYGRELTELAIKHHVNLLFEASVGGGIPIIRPLMQCLAANEIHTIMGILNGTTNYILSEMTEEGKNFKEVLKEAQEKGFAEADPTDDVKGYDAARKIAILSSIAFNTCVTDDDVFTEGIDKIDATDVKYARELGYNIKLIAKAKKHGNELQVSVTPLLIRQSHPISSVSGAFNAIMLEGNAVGRVMFYGQGAGKMPTASAVVADIMDVVRNKNGNKNYITYFKRFDIMDPGREFSRFYLRLKVKNMPRALTKISDILQENGVGLSKVIQKNSVKDITEIIIFTHEVAYQDLKHAINMIESYSELEEISNAIRIENET